ncbi:NAD-dependent epimerase [Flavobacterium magnum]|uniref:NAD-dependent epimerase n=1 Tax=Flavobacterium magnum TaxID=2162713 RepID=A0A2S0RE74_9FLAO|nr:NAD-dependent epimerase/dehydratase family protein [Flavobacterium magnum]AWA29012.1 NAD-dependent epimerase [Flavobacterium magnum]
MILVTGGTGLVGMHLLMLLAEKGEPVRAIYRNAARIDNVRQLFEMQGRASAFEAIDWQPGDVTDIPSLENVFSGVSKVYHCAAVVSFDPSEELLLRKTNIEGTANIVNFCLAKNVRKLCFFSSIAALGDLAVNEHHFSETTEWNPEKYHSDYAISKYGAEMEVWRGQQEGLQTVIVNPGVIIGPLPAKADWQQGSGRLFWETAKGMKYFTKGMTGFIGVWDVAKIAYQLMESDIRSERFVLVAENLPFDALSRTLTTELGVRPPTVYASRWMTSLAWRADWLLSALLFRKRKLSRATAHALHSQEQYDHSKVKAALDFDFEPIADVIRKTAVYFRETNV